MKNGNRFYMELSREIFQEPYISKLSMGAKMLFVTLNELEQRYCGNNYYSSHDHFLQTDKQLAEIMQCSVNSLKKYKSELKANASDLVRISKGRWVNSDTGKKSEQQFTCYKILR